MRRLAIAFALGSTLYWLYCIPQAFAGKVDNVKQAVKEKCNKEIPIEILRDSVVRAYDCQPEQEVTIASCKIKCLKGGSGNVVGQ
jgi:hypothetical protein